MSSRSVSWPGSAPRHKTTRAIRFLDVSELPSLFANTRWRSKDRLKFCVSPIALEMSNCRAKLSAALSARVPLITVDAVVDVARHVVVLEVRWVVIPVTAGALEHGVVIGIRVARRTNVVRISVG